MTTPGRNWAETHTYEAAALHRPAGVDELRRLVAAAPRIRALGTRHAFHDLADSPGVLVSLDAIPADVVVDPDARTATVGAGMRYGDLAPVLHDAGWALGAMASLPHISVAGAVATGTHGSGDRIPTLSDAVVALELVGPDGDLVTLREGDPDFAGAVVSLGALGIVTRVTLRVEPAYDVHQFVRNAVPWETVLGDFDAISSAADSVSLFTRWGTDVVDQVWMKSRRPTEPSVPWGAAATADQHPILGIDPVHATVQGGVGGPWFERLPHFRMGFTPSVGAEIQAEYLLPRDRAAEAFAALRTIGARIDPLLQVTEIRTMPGDDLWLSPSYGRDTVAIHFTLVREPDAVRRLLPEVEGALAPYAARPHWGKWFTLGRGALGELYPRLPDFVRLAGRLDPEGCFRNAFLEGTVFG
ncbi:FAD-binding protein [Mumia zhuanghuii]|uniref:D-arabinono-1,4-lactone oxidase n=2 Tax=Mumia TaxID=1546255 RepID=A0ABW1QMU0_9ACTN|nr:MULTISPECIES: D-arabinono-1,4-lactone oxidase [Mumia]KAA1424877.1 FAD-binding protein [Mumia zhuanghuii]